MHLWIFCPLVRVHHGCIRIQCHLSFSFVFCMKSRSSDAPWIQSQPTFSGSADKTCSSKNTITIVDDAMSDSGTSKGRGAVSLKAGRYCSPTTTHKFREKDNGPRRTMSSRRHFGICHVAGVARVFNSLGAWPDQDGDPPTPRPDLIRLSSCVSFLPLLLPFTFISLLTLEAFLTLCRARSRCRLTLRHHSDFARLSLHLHFHHFLIPAFQLLHHASSSSL